MKYYSRVGNELNEQGEAFMKDKLPIKLSVMFLAMAFLTQACTAPPDKKEVKSHAKEEASWTTCQPVFKELCGYKHTVSTLSRRYPGKMPDSKQKLIEQALSEIQHFNTKSKFHAACMSLQSGRKFQNSEWKLKNICKDITKGRRPD